MVEVIYTECDGAKFVSGQSQPLVGVRKEGARGYIMIGAYPQEVSDAQYEKLKADFGDKIKKVTPKMDVAEPIRVEYAKDKKPLIESKHVLIKPIEKTTTTYSREELESKAEKIGFHKFREWANRTFGVTDRSLSVLIKEILKKQK